MNDPPLQIGRSMHPAFAAFVHPCTSSKRLQQQAENDKSSVVCNRAERLLIISSKGEVSKYFFGLAEASGCNDQFAIYLDL